MRLVLALALSIAPLAVPAAPVQAQQRMLTIFGDDKCPSDTICVVAPESERYRIPKPFRDGAVEKSPDSVSWAVRSQQTLDVGKAGPGSCTPDGPGGWTGCFMKQMKEAYAEEKATQPETPEVP